ncbi:MAG: pseudouridine synthase [Steroidobacteraceae bacterium]
MTTRKKSPSGSFARAQRSTGAARGAVARRKAANSKTSKAKTKTGASAISESRNELIAHANRSHADKRSVKEGVRLQKALADAGVAARRDCEQMILKGRIQLNGVTVLELPCFIDPRLDVVALDGVPLDLSASIVREKDVNAPENRVYLLINKPKGMITTARDPEGRATVLQMVPHTILQRERLFPVGRLDADSTGLLLLTNDGDLAYQLTHPKFGVIKEYRVTTTGLASDEQLAKLKNGLYLLTPDKAGHARARRTNLEGVRVLKRFVDRSRGDRTVLSIHLREGQNREIRRLLARVGLKVRELERIAIGPLRATDLKPGQTKLLGKRDVERLRATMLSVS